MIHLQYRSVYTILVIRRSSGCGDYGCVFSPSAQVFFPCWSLGLFKVYQIGEDWVHSRHAAIQSLHLPPQINNMYDDQKCLFSKKKNKKYTTA